MTPTFETQLALNRLRNLAVLEMIGQAPESGRDTPTRHEATRLVRIDQIDCRAGETDGHVPEIAAHLNPRRSDDFESKSDAGKRDANQPQQPKTEPGESRRYIEDRLRKIAEFERSYQNGAIDAGRVRPRPRSKRD